MRALWTAAAGASLALCVATCALWVRSYRISDTLEYASHPAPGGGQWKEEGRAMTARSRLGRVAIVLQRGFAVQDQKPDDGLDYHRVPGWHRWSRVNVPVPRDLTSTSPDDPYTDHPRRSYHGFGIDRVDDRDRDTIWWTFVVVPHWAIAATTAILPAIYVVRVGRRERRRRAGRCIACGYDCRATPNRCPECGAVPRANDARPGAAGR